jgi:hypothetical protein
MTKFDGNGSTIKFVQGDGAGTALIGINSITLPGDSISVIDATTLNNAEVKTSISANLKAVNDLTFNLDLADILQLPAKGVRCQAVITLPGDFGTWSGWGFISATNDASLMNDSSPSVDVTFTVGNLNAAGKESAPVISINAGA